MKPTLLVDIDGVLCEQGDRLRSLVLDVTDGRVRLEPGDCRHYDFTDCVAADGAALTKDEWREVVRRYGDPETIASLPVMPGAAEGLERLTFLYDIAIVTTRRPELREATERWLDGWALFPRSLTFVGHRRKHEVPGVAVAVEDDYDQAALFSQVGVPCVLMSWPWNTGRPPLYGVTWASGWDWIAANINLFHWCCQWARHESVETD